MYDIYARKEKDGYPDRSSPFYRPVDFQPQTVQLFGAQPEAKIEVEMGDKAGVLIGIVIDGETEEPLDASVNLVSMQVSGAPNGANGEHAEIKNGRFRELVPENTDVYVYVQKAGAPGTPTWSHFSLKVFLEPGEERSLDIRLYKNPTP